MNQNPQPGRPPQPSPQEQMKAVDQHTDHLAEVLEDAVYHVHEGMNAQEVRQLQQRLSDVAQSLKDTGKDVGQPVPARPAPLKLSDTADPRFQRGRLSAAGNMGSAARAEGPQFGPSDVRAGSIPGAVPQTGRTPDAGPGAAADAVKAAGHPPPADTTGQPHGNAATGEGQPPAGPNPTPSNATAGKSPPATGPAAGQDKPRK